MNLKLSVRRRACWLLVLLAVVLVLVLRLSFRRESSETWTTYRTGSETGAGDGPEGRWRRSDSRTVLLWTEFFGKKDYIQPLSQLGCPELRCLVTSNRTKLDEADAVVLHARDTKLEDLPARRYPRQRWVLLHHESPHHTPNFFRQLDGRINWTVTYRLDSDVVLSPRPVRKAAVATRPPPPRDLASSKTRMVVWFVSNCATSSNREAFVRELQKTVPVDVVGSCGGRECVPKMSEECYTDAARQYRFYLSFENSLCKDYVTEKFFHVLNYDMVPVVFGGADYAAVAPPGSYVDALAFDSPRAVGKHLLELAKDPARYDAFFAWRRGYEMRGEHYACTLCRKLHDPAEPAKVWNRLHSWWFDEAKCTRWNPRRQTLIPS